MNRNDEIKRVTILDTTLRDGEQAPGIVFSKKDKIDIAVRLRDAGIDEIEAGIPAMGEDECEIISAIQKAVSGSRILTWCRATLPDIHMAETCGTGRVHISFPVSPVLLNVFEKDQEWIRQQMEVLIPAALERFDFVSVGAQDAARCEPEELKNMISHAEKLGAHRFRIADTIGIADPFSLDGLFRGIRDSGIGIPLEFHGHNDLGMATANTLAAVRGGASAVNVTVNGIGERAGNAALEEVAVALAKTETAATGIRFDRLQALCSHVASLCERLIPPDNPVTGSDIFHHESGIHCNALLKDPDAYQSVKPSDMGQETAAFHIGKFSGRASVKHVLNEAGVSITDETAGEILPLIRREATEKKRALTVEELLAMVS